MRGFIVGIGLWKWKAFVGLRFKRYTSTAEQCGKKERFFFFALKQLCQTSSSKDKKKLSKQKYVNVWGKVPAAHKKLQKLNIFCCTDQIPDSIRWAHQCFISPYKPCWVKQRKWLHESLLISISDYKEELPTEWSSNLLSCNYSSLRTAHGTWGLNNKT